MTPTLYISLLSFPVPTEEAHIDGKKSLQHSAEIRLHRCCFVNFHLLILSVNEETSVHIYIYMCVCVCVFAFLNNCLSHSLQTWGAGKRRIAVSSYAKSVRPIFFNVISDLSDYVTLLHFL